MILVLKLNRPEKQNALTREMYQELANAINEAHGDFGVRAAVITTTSKHFTAGNDLFDFLNEPPIEPGSPVMNFLEAIHNFAKPLFVCALVCLCVCAFVCMCFFDMVWLALLV